MRSVTISASATTTCTRWRTWSRIARISAPLIALDGVACLRGQRLLFEGLSLSLEAGEALAVRGPNGAGKSSLLRLCAGLMRAAAGTVERHGTVALADEALALDMERPLAAALRWWAGLDGADYGDAMERMGIAHLAEVPVRLLSTGQRKRAALARVIGSGAAIWLLDEPLNGLDGDGQARIEAAVAAHRASGGVALVASHQSFVLPDARELVLA